MKDPAFLFYSSDFLTGTLLMDNEQVGKYIRLLCLQHQKKRLTKKDMLKICVEYDSDIFEKFTEDETGFFNKRLDEEIKRRIEYSESRRKNREGKTKDMNKICKTYDTHMETENETEDLNKNNGINKNWNFLKDQLINLDSQNYEKIASAHKMSLEQVRQGMIDFLDKMERTEDIYRTKIQYLSHFDNWIKLQKKEDSMIEKRKRESEQYLKQQELIRLEFEKENKI